MENKRKELLVYRVSVCLEPYQVPQSARVSPVHDDVTGDTTRMRSDQ